MAFKAKFTPAKTQKFLGLGQLFTNLLRYNSVDTEQSDAANAYRNWEVKLAHRLGALVRSDTVKIDTTFGTLPSTAYGVLLKKRERVQDKWISALRVQLVQAGTMSSYKGNVVPYQDGADWIFRIETYNPNHPVLEYYELDTTADYLTFNALRKESTDREWKHYQTNLSLQTVTTPFTVTGVQNLIDILFGYVHRLDELGFRFNIGENIITDAETGRNLDWQLEIEKLVDRIYRNLGPGQGHILNPFMHSVWLDTPIGLQSQFSDSVFIDVNASQAVFDITGAAIPVRKLDVVRMDDHTVTYSEVPIFSAHLFLDEYEHVILFNNNVSEEEGSFTIFDPFLGLRIQTAYLNYTRQEEITRKPHFPGFVLSGNTVVRNVTSSVDAIGKYYDAGQTFDEPLTSEHALSLLGYNKKNYFNSLGTSDATQFNFWRGLIHAKGTNMSVDAFVNYKKFMKAEVDEYWAYKIAEYGDARTRSFPEVKIEVADSVQKFTQLQFYTEGVTQYEALPNFTQIESSDDLRWYDIDDLGHGVNFRADKIDLRLPVNMPLGYHQLDTIFHNDAGFEKTYYNTGPKVYVRTTVYPVYGGVRGYALGTVESVATTAKMINASLLRVTGTPNNTPSLPLPGGTPTIEPEIYFADYFEETGPLGDHVSSNGISWSVPDASGTIYLNGLRFNTVTNRAYIANAQAVSTAPFYLRFVINNGTFEGDLQFKAGIALDFDTPIITLENNSSGEFCLNTPDGTVILDSAYASDASYQIEVEPGEIRINRWYSDVHDTYTYAMSAPFSTLAGAKPAIISYYDSMYFQALEYGTMGMEGTAPPEPDSYEYDYEYSIKGYTWRNPTKVSPVKLFDYVEKELIKEFVPWHPAIGIHAHEPLEIISSISSKDPAFYNTTGQVVNNPNYVSLKSWGKKEVGRVWWDTSNLGYIPYYDATIFPDRNERHARWGNLAEWASIDLYEWVESDVPPGEFDALALQEEGQSDIHASVRASGKAARKTNYKRNRIISLKPIAWSQSPVGGVNAHPSFGPGMQKVFIADNGIYIDAGRLSDFNLVPNNHFSAWKNNVPFGEVILNEDNLVYQIGSSNNLTSPSVLASGVLTSISVSAIPDGRLGEMIGQLTLTSHLEQRDAAVYIRRLKITGEDGTYDEVVLDDWLPDSDNSLMIEFLNAGVRIQVQRDPMTTTYAAGDLAADIVTSWVDVYVREGNGFTQILELPDNVFINDENDPDYFDVDYGWVTYAVPTQDDLDADLAFPHHKWHPYLGATEQIVATSDIVKDIGADTLTLRNGIPITRYEMSWTDWTPLNPIRIEKISTGSIISFSRSEFLESDEKININRISLFIDGIQVSPKNYTVIETFGSESVTLPNVLSIGTTVRFVYRAYEPTAEEFDFDPAIQDDPSIQVQFKSDYQYTKIDQRNENGSIIGAKYYFWVEDSTVVRPNKNMSLLQAKSILQNGPDEYVKFESIVNSKDAFDSIVIAGLNKYVTNNDTYKLRFGNDETLRDDPENMSLRNVHTEWSLMRRGQNKKIPLSLWQHLTNAAAGADAGGNPLPAQIRVDYDERNGTRTRFGFKPGQIFADTELVRTTITHTILNTSLELKVGGRSIPDYITVLDFDKSDEWFKDAETARATMDSIWSSARAKQVNEIFFAVLEDALANNYEFSDIFKTSLVSIYTTTAVEEKTEEELADGIN